LKKVPHALVSNQYILEIEIEYKTKIWVKKLDTLPRPPAVQTVFSDIEAAIWSAVREVFPGVTQCGCTCHYAQAVWRNVQSVGLQSAYARDEVINLVCQKTMTYCFLPEDVITDKFEKIEEATRDGNDRIQEHLQYIRRNWIAGAWRPATWSVFGQPVRTNNDVEGWHHRLTAKANYRRLNLYQLLQLPHDEARLVTLAVRLLSECGTSHMPRKAYAQLHSHIFMLWCEYSMGSRSASILLRACSQMCHS